MHVWAIMMLQGQVQPEILQHVDEVCSWALRQGPTLLLPTMHSTWPAFLCRSHTCARPL